MRGIHRWPQRTSNAENVSIWWRHHDSLEKPPFQLGHGWWVVTWHSFVWMQLLIHALHSLLVGLIFVSASGPCPTPDQYSTVCHMGKSLLIMIPIARHTPIYYQFFMLVSRHGHVFCITGHLWGESTGTPVDSLHKEPVIQSFVMSPLLSVTSFRPTSRDVCYLAVAWYHCDMVDSCHRVTYFVQVCFK